MTVTTCLEGPTKASRRLSPLTTRALGVGWASRHTMLAAGSTEAQGQLGGDPNLPPAVANRQQWARAMAGIAGVLLDHDRLPSDRLAGPSYYLAATRGNTCPRVTQPPPSAQAIHLLPGQGWHRPSLTFRFGGPKKF